MTSADVVMFIRHAEKPAESGTPQGINHKGEADPHSLSVRGWTRAGALAALFAYAPHDSHVGIVVPDRVIATKSSDGYKSKREVNTATPVARRLNVDVDESFDHSQAKELAASLLQHSGDALVVWHHGSMPEVISLLPVSNRGDIPAHWPDDRFDLIWVLTRDESAQAYRFAEVEQALLDGDAAPA
jgi:hypothetical protein